MGKIFRSAQIREGVKIRSVSEICYVDNWNAQLTSPRQTLPSGANEIVDALINRFRDSCLELHVSNVFQADRMLLSRF